MKGEADSHPVNAPDIGADRRHNLCRRPPRTLGRSGDTNGDNRGNFGQELAGTMAGGSKLLDHGTVGNAKDRRTPL